MFSVRSLLVVALSLFFSSISTSLWAEQSKTFSDYVVYYNAFSTDMLQPAVAKQYGIKIISDSDLSKIIHHVEEFVSEKYSRNGEK